jgi:DNA-binding CsgD family transcriptional regulator
VTRRRSSATQAPGGTVARWPLVGRDTELARILEVAPAAGTPTEPATGDPAASAVLLIGPAGVGKTRLAEECLSRLSPVRAGGRGPRTLRVRATRAAAALPLGALAPLLPRLDVPDAMLLPAARQALLGTGTGARVLLLVDDAQHLDPVSAALVHQLVSARQVFALLTVRAGESLPDALDALWKDEQALRIELDRLTDDAIEMLTQELLPGSVDLFTCRELSRLAAGNPLALREIIAHARSTGTLRQQPGRGWTVPGRIAAPRHLLDVIARRVGELPAEQREALRLVALAEPIGRPLAAKLTGPEPLDALERAGLITVDINGLRHNLRLAHPLFGEAATQDLATTDRQALTAQLADTLRDTGMRRLDDIVRVADWRLTAGDIGGPELMLSAARRSLALHDLRSVVRFASAGRAVGGGPTAAFLLGYAQARTGEFAEAERNLAAGMAAADLPPQLAAMIGIARSDNLFSGIGDWPAADEVIQQTVTRLAESPYRTEVCAHRARLLWLHGEAEAAFDTIAPLTEQPGSRAWVLGSVLLGVSLPWAGRPLEALAVAGRAQPVHEELWRREMVQFSPLTHDLGRLFALLFGGRLDEAAGLATHLWSDASRTDQIPDLGLLAMLTGFVAKEQGKLVTARHWLGRSVEIFERGSPAKLRWPLSILVETEVEAGSMDRARQAADRLHGLRDGPVRNTDGMEEIFLASLAAAEGAIPEAERRLVAVADRFHASARRTIAVYAIHALTRIGRAKSAAGFVAALRPQVEPGLLSIRLDFADAATASDPAALAAAGQAFQAAGAHLFAAEAWSEAGRCYVRRGERRQATGVLREARGSLDRCEAARTTLLLTTDPAGDALTAREREIAVLAANGLSNKEIGEQLFLSQRTVENHLQRGYRKLGITRRDEIGRALAP